MTLKEDALRFTLMKTLTDLVKGETDEARAELTERLIEVFEDMGTKAITVHVPGAEKVATLTLSEPKPATKVNTQTLMAWCELNRPDLLDEIVHPATEAWTETVLGEDIEAELMKSCALVGDTYYTADGLAVEGLTYVPAGRPKSFMVKYEKGGQARVIQAWHDGDLAGIDAGKNLPKIGE